MSRTIPKGLSGVLEALELERPQLVTMPQLAGICEKAGVRTPAKVVASRLRERGWLLPTTQRGVWEFAPATAGKFSLVFSDLPLLGIHHNRKGERFQRACKLLRIRSRLLQDEALHDIEHASRDKCLHSPIR